MSSANKRMLLAVVVALAGVLSAAIAALGQSGGGPIGEPGPLVAVGPGAAESSIRQAVRTPGGRVYIAAADDFGASGERTVLRMYRADQTGVPTSFAEADASNAPAVGPGDTMSGGELRLDRDGTIHVSYYRRGTGRALYQTFSPATDRWGGPEEVNPGSVFPGGKVGLRGHVPTGMALDASGVPHVAVTGPGSVRVYRRTSAGSWTARSIVEGAGANLHPSMTFDRRGRLHLSWLDDASPPNTAIRYARREADGAWSPVETVASGDVLTNGNADQSPSLAVDASDRPVVLYLNGTGAMDTDFVRLRVRTDAGWEDDSPSPDVDTHTPGLHMRGDDRLVLEGHDIPGVDPAYLSRRAGEGGWSSERVFGAQTPADDRQYDGSGNSRFDPLYDTDCNLVDAVFFDEDSDARGGFRPDLYYAAIALPRMDCPNVVGTPGSPPPLAARDRTKPRVTRVGLSRRRFRRGAAGVRLSFGLSEKAGVRVRARRRSFVIRARRGRNIARLALRGRLRSLRPGRYRLRLYARDRAGNRSRTVSVRFVVVRARRR